MESYGPPSLGFTPGPLHEKSLGTLQGTTQNILSEGHNFSTTPSLGKTLARGGFKHPAKFAKKGFKLAKKAFDPRTGLKIARKAFDPRTGVKIAKKIGEKQLDVAKKVGKTGINVAKKVGKAGLGAAKKGFDVAKKVFDPFGLFGGDKYHKEPQGTRARINQRAESGSEGKGGFGHREVRRAFKRGTEKVQTARSIGRGAISYQRSHGERGTERRAKVAELKQARHTDVRSAQRARTKGIAAARASRRTKSFSMPGRQVY